MTGFKVGVDGFPACVTPRLTAKFYNAVSRAGVRQGTATLPTVRRDALNQLHKTHKKRPQLILKSF